MPPKSVGKRGRELREAWVRMFAEYRQRYPELGDHLLKMQWRELPDGWDRDIPEFPPDAKGVSGRDASGKVLNAVAKNVPRLIGGAADLAPSTKTFGFTPEHVVAAAKAQLERAEDSK